MPDLLAEDSPPPTFSLGVLNVYESARCFLPRIGYHSYSLLSSPPWADGTS